LDLTSYQSIMKGSQDGAVIIPGDPTGSLLVQKQSAPHSKNFTSDELARIVQWIKDGALEK